MRSTTTKKADRKTLFFQGGISVLEQAEPRHSITGRDHIQLIVEKVRQRSHDRSTDRTDRAFEIDAKSKEQASSYQRVGRLSI